MQPLFDIDEAKLAAYLESQVEGFQGPLSADKFAGGQSNPTYIKYFLWSRKKSTV
jgi:aminoglycoside phosphotransferase (APT) family kinase protein